MMFTVLSKELALHILTLRFQVGLLVCVGFVATVTWIATVGHQKRLEAHQAIVAEARQDLKAVTVYSDLSSTHRLLTARDPRPLAIFRRGVEGRLADHFEVSHGLAPGSGGGLQEGDAFARLFSDYDVVTVLQVILSFLAILFAFDAISGERETGTLILALSNPGSRAALLAGKYLGALVSLSVPVILSFLVAVLVVRIAGVSLMPDDWIRLGLIAGLSLLYLSVFLLLALLLSARTAASVTTLLWATLAWVGVVLLYPTLVLFSVERLRPLPPPDATVAAVEDLESQFEDEVEGFLKREGKEKEWEGLRGSRGVSSDDHGETVHVTPKRDDDGAMPDAVAAAMAFAPRVYAFKEPLRAEYADRADRLWRAYFEDELYAQADLAWALLRLSPAGLLAEATAIAADTDAGSYRAFTDQARAFRKDLIRWLEGRGAFGSRLWFNDEEEQLTNDAIPQFVERHEGVGAVLNRLAPRVCALVLLNAVLFLAALAAFRRAPVV